MVTARLTCTVCVVVLDRFAAMERCLDSLFRLAVPLGTDLDVVVVDNGSRDGTWEMLQTYAAHEPRLTVTRLEGSVGRARNAALAAAKGDLVAFTDSDCEPEPGWLVHGVVPFADPAVAVVQGRTVPGGATDRPWAVTQDIGSRSGLFEACNILYRRELLLAAGGFGEDIGFFGEDTVAGWRVLRAGGAAAFAHEAVVRHDVTFPGYRWHLGRARYYAHWPALVAEFPEVRDTLLWHRWFLRRRSAESTAALLGLLLALVTRRPGAAVAGVPLLWRHRPRGRTRADLRDAGGALLFDVAVSAALVEGSVRSRTLLL